MALVKKRDIKGEFNTYLRLNIAEIIRSKQGKKELIDVINKHAEAKRAMGYGVKPLPYTIGGVDLAGIINEYLNSKNASFNKDLSILVYKHLRNRPSNAEGDPISSMGQDHSNINGAINNMSVAGASSVDAAEKHQDDIALALINGGITKKKTFRRWVLIAIVVIILGGLIYYFWTHRKVAGVDMETKLPGTTPADSVVE